MGEFAETVAQLVTMFIAVASFFGVNHYTQFNESPLGQLTRRVIKWLLLGMLVGTFLWMLAPERFTWNTVAIPFTAMSFGLLLFSELGRLVRSPSIVLPAVCASLGGGAIGIVVHIGPFGTALFSLYGLIGGAVVAVSELPYTTAHA